jgi:hypothetical protein
MYINYEEARLVLDLNTPFCIVVKNKINNDIKIFVRVKPRLI